MKTKWKMALGAAAIAAYFGGVAYNTVKTADELSDLEVKFETAAEKIFNCNVANNLESPDRFEVCQGVEKARGDIFNIVYERDERVKSGCFSLGWYVKSTYEDTSNGFAHIGKIVCWSPF